MKPSRYAHRLTAVGFGFDHPSSVSTCESYAGIGRPFHASYEFYFALLQTIA